MQKFLKIRVLLYLMIAGGIMGVIGTFLIQFFMFVTFFWGQPIPWNHFSSPGLVDMVLQFFTGGISVGIFGLFFLGKVLAPSYKKESWPIWGALFGGTAGFLNSFLLAAIGLTLYETSLRDALKMLRTYLPINAVIMGPPAAIIGALAGIIAELLLRRFLLAKRNGIQEAKRVKKQ